MRLIRVDTLEMSEFFGLDIPPYAILSHTWDREEVTFQDWQHLKKASKKKGFAKIRSACRQARLDGHRWLWVDTNCIDKTSSAELTEAINSMYGWYADARVCYAYLSDIQPGTKQFESSRWFSRGWTLQELIAPQEVVFFYANWTFAGRKNCPSIATRITQTTGIAVYVIHDPGKITRSSVAEKMSWLAGRETTRVEDLAYCMLGLFDINMPLLYGEGMKAFTRLQEEIIKVSTDHSIFCWHWTRSVPKDWVSLLAPSPDMFESASEYEPLHQKRPQAHEYRRLFNHNPIYSMTNAGLSIRLPIVKAMEGYMICLNVGAQYDKGKTMEMDYVFIPVDGYYIGDMFNVWRSGYPERPILINVLSFGSLIAKPLLAASRPETLNYDGYISRFHPEMDKLAAHGLLVLCDSGLDEASLDGNVIFGLEMEGWGKIPSESRTSIVSPDWTYYRPYGAIPGIEAELLRLSRAPGITDPNSRAYLFIAVDSRGEESIWFCQVFVGPEDLYLDKALTLLRLMDQVKTSPMQQEAHYNEVADISAVIDSHVYPTDDYKKLRVLILSQGHTRYRGTAGATGDDGEGSGSDVRSTIAEAGKTSKSSWLAPRTGQFFIEGI